MIDLTRKSLPNTIEVYGRAFSVYTDFRVWLRFEIELAEHRSKEPLNIDYIFKNDRPVYCPIRDILQFARPKNELPRSVRGTSDARLIDFRVDSDLIYAAFLQQYGIDLIDVPVKLWHRVLHNRQVLLSRLRHPSMMLRKEPNKTLNRPMWQLV